MITKLLRAEQVAELLAIDPKKVYLLPLPRVRVSGNSFRYRPQDVDRYVTERLENPRRALTSVNRSQNGHLTQGKKVSGIQSLLVKKLLYAIQLGQQEIRRTKTSQELRPIELTEVVQEPLFSLKNQRLPRRFPFN